MTTLRDWLIDDSPASPMQARLGRFYRIFGAGPTVAPLVSPDGTPLPYVASNEITVFSLLDSAAGVVRSYRHDTRHPASPAVLFDEFPLT